MIYSHEVFRRTKLQRKYNLNLAHHFRKALLIDKSLNTHWKVTFKLLTVDRFDDIFLELGSESFEVLRRFFFRSTSNYLPRETYIISLFETRFNAVGKSKDRWSSSCNTCTFLCGDTGTSCCWNIWWKRDFKTVLMVFSKEVHSVFWAIRL